MAFSLPPELLASAADITLPNLLEAQERLEAEAREVLPYSFDECTFSKGAIRQSVWSCMDCGNKGVCYGCSIACHSEHRLVELWSKRSFTCDCPTSAMCSPSSSKRRCNIFPPDQQPQPPNEGNAGRYTHNFVGEFCRCGRDYDPETETEAMIHCIGCEDWFHESCLNLAPRKPERDTPLPEEEEESDSLLPSESYDGLLCAACADHPFVAERKGRDGWMVVVPRGDEWVVEGRKEGEEGSGRARMVEKAEEPAWGGEAGPALGKKRASEDEGPAAKRVKVEAPGQVLTEAVTAEPTVEPTAEPTAIPTSTVPPPAQATAEPRRAAGDVFLADGVRDHLKATLSDAEAAALPFPLVDEEIYEPPADSPPETLEAVTERVVSALPRVQAIEALYGYESMRDKLKVMLAAHVQSGQAVSRDDIETFFENLRAQRAT
ncbi:hypothetical protein CC85DRAFT_286164 [Cutaneotrichosporon oleaginosum]|uniref:UBR-type domain-containing protein n=1 Tax=Cutaneotrichosporon oleaginosum TaxID=879819 RepID=A0A0J0XKY4_9TREE|nr:uncharacterized protein CC85DRAFT_286164 [Cutaneotrichosporon oleaginosum]KLT41761.1 hypothetical protein CC85DRAFT_286164 [Cutaneotrichosporon oleaginosum]TXT12357.1 hypothetical protein COLE_02767 [Cutaneotrichosporon oleaginosum]